MCAASTARRGAARVAAAAVGRARHPARVPDARAAGAHAEPGARPNCCRARWPSVRAACRARSSPGRRWAVRSTSPARRGPYAACTALFVLAAALCGDDPLPARAARRRRLDRHAARGRALRAPSARSCWARSRSTCSRCCSAAPPRCCRSSPRTCCTSARGAWACCAARRRWVRSRCRWRSRAGRSGAAPGRRLLARRGGVRRGDRGVRPVDAASRCRWRRWPSRGAADMVSVVIRQTLVQLETPDDDARPRQRGQLGVHRRVEPARRVRVRRHRRAGSGRWRRWCSAASAPASLPSRGGACSRTSRGATDFSRTPRQHRGGDREKAMQWLGPWRALRSTGRGFQYAAGGEAHQAGTQGSDCR